MSELHWQLIIPDTKLDKCWFADTSIGSSNSTLRLLLKIKQKYQKFHSRSQTLNMLSLFLYLSHSLSSSNVHCNLNFIRQMVIQVLSLCVTFALIQMASESYWKTNSKRSSRYWAINSIKNNTAESQHCNTTATNETVSLHFRFIYSCGCWLFLYFFLFSVFVALPLEIERIPDRLYTSDAYKFLGTLNKTKSCQSFSKCAILLECKTALSNRRIEKPTHTYTH